MDKKAFERVQEALEGQHMLELDPREVADEDIRFLTIRFEGTSTLAGILNALDSKKLLTKGDSEPPVLKIHSTERGAVTLEDIYPESS